jgi:hypothetical protein
MALKMRSELAAPDDGGSRDQVNGKYSRIFNGIIETRNSSKSEQKNAETCGYKPWAPRVKHLRIYHDGRL